MITLKISGMMCENCKASVNKAISAINGVESVDISLKEGKAVVSCSDSVTKAMLIDAVKDAGYEAE